MPAGVVLVGRQALRPHQARLALGALRAGGLGGAGAGSDDGRHGGAADSDGRGAAVRLPRGCGPDAQAAFGGLLPRAESSQPDRTRDPGPGLDRREWASAGQGGDGGGGGFGRALSAPCVVSPVSRSRPPPGEFDGAWPRSESTLTGP